MDDELDFDPSGTPRSRRFDDIYFSPDDGRAESAFVFHAASGFPDAAPERAVVAELGFGVGLNFALSLRAWAAARPHAPLDYVAFEIAPPPMDAVMRSLARWPDLADAIAPLAASWPPAPGWSTHAVGPARLRLAVGDARAWVPDWRAAADFWFLDGFAPAKNPEMWDPALLSHVFERTRPGGVAVTYAAAGAVRRGLRAAGFDVERRPGFGRKREMLLGRRPATAPGALTDG